MMMSSSPVVFAIVSAKCGTCAPLNAAVDATIIRAAPTPLKDHPLAPLFNAGVSRILWVKFASLVVDMRFAVTSFAVVGDEVVPTRGVGGSGGGGGGVNIPTPQSWTCHMKTFPTWFLTTESWLARTPTFGSFGAFVTMRGALRVINAADPKPPRAIRWDAMPATSAIAEALDANKVVSGDVTHAANAAAAALQLGPFIADIEVTLSSAVTDGNGVAERDAYDTMSSSPEVSFVSPRPRW